MNTQDTKLILIDGHVHIYDCFEPVRLLRSALGNFHAQARKVSNPKQFAGILFLTESKGCHRFDELASYANECKNIVENRALKWSVSLQNDDKKLLRVSSSENEELLIWQGRQVASIEGLEILALGIDDCVDDGLTFEQSLNAIEIAGGISVLPWAVGKWLGQRGKLVSKIIQSELHGSCLIGDNSGRPWFWKAPAQFTYAGKRHIKNVPGTDPLPLSGEENRVGSYGSYMKIHQDDVITSQFIKKLLLDQNVELTPYGKPESLGGFLRNQVGLRLKRT